VEHPKTKQYIHEGATLQLVGLSHSYDQWATGVREHCLKTRAHASDQSAKASDRTQI
jgi:hypothetical protein